MKAYIQDRKLLGRSKYHTSYVGDGPISDDPRRPNRIYSLTFINGVAQTDEMTFQRFKDAGHCDKQPINIWTPDD
jgi:hypothetical protein